MTEGTAVGCFGAELELLAFNLTIGHLESEQANIIFKAYANNTSIVLQHAMGCMMIRPNKQCIPKHTNLNDALRFSVWTGVEASFLYLLRWQEEKKIPFYFMLLDSSK